ncbi:uncharacterized protein LOC135843652 isoform X2 [Planococcus citri]|uniref:uncharacterized protein LOC135843652 isoform X2 n=1 Tax=Planococcus citri TaxID=170843 RepID=UPI0031F8D47F
MAKGNPFASQERIRIFEIDYPDWNEVLSMFHDFALDWDGTIHEVRTAKRMLLCDRIGINVKFRIACLYCFEDDIKRIWPSVSSTMNLDRLSFTEFPQLYYWTCLLSDKPHMVPNIGETVFSQFYKTASMDYSSALYYWNRIPLESQSQKFIRDLLDNNPKLFSRFILPKLNEPKLVEFIARNVERLIRTLLNGHEHEERDRLVLPTWMYIRNKIDKKTFVHLIKNLLVKEAFDIQPREQLIYQSEVSPWCEIWNSAAQILKQAVFDDILLKDSEYLFRPYDFPRASSRQTRLLMAVLSDASFQERSTFWSKNWPSLILGTCVEDLLEIMKLCFRNEEEIALFKENTLFKYENIRPYLTFVLERPERKYYFREVDRFLYFCNSDAQKIMEMKQRFLHDPNNGIPHGLPLSRNEESLNKFLNDTVWKMQMSLPIAIKFIFYT